MSLTEHPRSDLLERALAEYDEALASGRPPIDASLASHLDGRDDLQAFRKCQGVVQLLEKAWPRSDWTRETIHDHARAMELVRALEDSSDSTRRLRPLLTVESLRRILADLRRDGEHDITLAECARCDDPKSIAYMLVQEGLLSESQIALLGRHGVESVALGDFLLLEELGQGGMGVVYRAWSRAYRTEVALKTLAVDTSAARDRLKREFRIAVDIVHPNLIHLHRLYEFEGRLFFTMEFVQGVRFTDDARDATSDHLRDLLLQITLGLRALHGEGVLHRDIKPSNVLVQPDGRLLLIDFGIAASRSPSDGQVGDLPRAGTWLYMAPEACEGRPLSPAADWYGVGVMLHEALTGVLPFVGGKDDVLAAKRAGSPLEGLDRVPEELRDLADLCRRLLHPTPLERPTGDDVLRMLGVSKEQRERLDAGAPRRRDAVPFVGRESELRALRDMLQNAREGRPACVVVSGPPGGGKSAFVRRFLEEQRDETAPFVMSGRCRQDELVMYKGFEGAFEAFAERHRRKTRAAGEAVEREASALPYLLSILTTSGQEGTAEPDGQEKRTTAVREFRRVLGEMCLERETVLFLDDVQWADPDGLALLKAVFFSDDPPPALLIMAHRTAEGGSSCLASLAERLGGTPSWLQERVVERTLPPLGTEEIRRLAEQGSDRTRSIADEEVESIRRQSGGLPILVAEYLAGETNGTNPGVVGDSRLAHGLRDRMAPLRESARDLLRSVAVAGRPVDMRAAVAASGRSLDALERDAAALRARRLVLLDHEAGTVETYHDLVRSYVLSSLDSEVTRRLHGGWVDVLEQSETPAYDQLYTHCRAADRPRSARRYAELAARRAQRSFAFSHAAEMYAAALELEDVPAVRFELQRRRAAALSDAGAGREAAEVHEAIAAACSSDPPKYYDAKRRVAEELLRIGEFEEALVQLRIALDGLGIRTSNSLFGLLVSIARDECIRRWPFRSKQPRSASEVPIELRNRTEALFDVAKILTNVHPEMFVEMIFRLGRYAAISREPLRLAQFKGMTGIVLIALGRFSAAERILNEVENVFAKHGDVMDSGAVDCFRGWLHCFQGRWRESLSSVDKAFARVEYHKTSRMGVELSYPALPISPSLTMLGEIGELERRAEDWIRKYADRRSVFLDVTPRCYWWVLGRLRSLSADVVREEAAEAMKPWRSQRFSVSHALEIFGYLLLELHSGEGVPTQDLLEREWRRSFWPILRGTMFFRTECRWLRSLTHLARMRDGSRDPVHARTVRRHSQEILREPIDWPKGVACSLDAQLALLRGDEDGALALFVRGEESCRSLNMPLLEQCMKRARGLLLQGDEGETLVRETEAWIAERGADDVRGIANIFTPVLREA